MLDKLINFLYWLTVAVFCIKFTDELLVTDSIILSCVVFILLITEQNYVNELHKKGISSYMFNASIFYQTVKKTWSWNNFKLFFLKLKINVLLCSQAIKKNLAISGYWGAWRKNNKFVNLIVYFLKLITKNLFWWRKLQQLLPFSAEYVNRKSSAYQINVIVYYYTGIVFFLIITSIFFLVSYLKKYNILWTTQFLHLFNTIDSCFMFKTMRNGIGLYFNIDTLSLFLVLLTGFIMLLCFNYCIFTIKKKTELCLFYLATIYVFLIISFTISDLLYFYIGFESVLAPMFLLIGIWGSRARKIKANFYFFLYTVFGSFFLLFGIMYIYTSFNTTNFQVFSYFGLIEGLQAKLWICFFLPFAIKTPIIPFHIWLPEAHVEAPTLGSVILAGLLLKLGTYGFIRFTLPFFSYANNLYISCIYVVSLISVIFGSFFTIRQIDLKKIIAYSSVAHMNLSVLGIFSNNLLGFDGAFYLMIAHGIVSPGLFFLIGMLYEKIYTRLILYVGGLNLILPLWVFCLFNLIIANMGFPGTCNFIGEILIIFGVWEKNAVVCLLMTTTVVWSAIYSIWMFNRISFGTFKTTYLSVQTIQNLKFNCTQLTINIIIVTFMWVFGITSDLLITTNTALDGFLCFNF